eukprot:CAMPEP_0196723222 /NCGR_PEP_ID=MMETSP1091-20130531/5366_1 /TAXON_ID=302021 /ORGANISM="Rhodomonas sp., Strain CCMP768" /LENGTH=111 /DNA_ID=CAMNT_0042065071 /DNA_START=37 /DNA_END=372 /DNA_ORIENTATION=+
MTPDQANDRALQALRHSLALLSQARGDESQMRDILARNRADTAQGFRHISVLESPSTPIVPAGEKNAERRMETALGQSALWLAVPPPQLQSLALEGISLESLNNDVARRQT